MHPQKLKPSRQLLSAAQPLIKALLSPLLQPNIWCRAEQLMLLVQVCGYVPFFLLLAPFVVAHAFIQEKRNNQPKWLLGLFVCASESWNWNRKVGEQPSLAWRKGFFWLASWKFYKSFTIIKLL